jgi:GT2 family glycosyltransferase
LTLNAIKSTIDKPDHIRVPLVSVIITTRNEKDTIKDSIISILEQTYPNFEIVIIDARSSDGTFEKVAELETLSRSYKNCKRYSFYSVEADSPAKGRNIGVRTALGTIIAFTDADCMPERDWLANLIKYIPRKLGIVGGPNILCHFKTSKIVNAIDSVLATYLGSGGAPQFLKIKKVSEVYGVPTCNFAMQKSLFDSVGGFDEQLRYNEDSDLCKRVRDRGHKIIYTPHAKVHHFMGLDSFSEFTQIIYKYGFERGKNIAKNSKFFTKFNAISIILILTLSSLYILSFFVVATLTILLALISCVILIVIIFCVNISLVNKSATLGFLALPIFISIFALHNTGLLAGYIFNKSKGFVNLNFYFY